MKFSNSFVLLVAAFYCVLAMPDFGHRVRRQNSIDFSKPLGGGRAYGSLSEAQSGGLDGTLGYSRNIFDNNYGRLDGTAQASRTWGAPGGREPTHLGGALDYTGQGVTAGLGVDHAMRGGTTLGAHAGAAWKLGPNTDVSATGTYSRTYGPGAGTPNYGVMGTLRHRFRRSPRAEYYDYENMFTREQLDKH